MLMGNGGQQMLVIHPEYVVDEQQRKKAVILPFSEWEKVMAEIEELDDIRAYDRAKSVENEIIPFEQAVQEIQSGDLS